QFRGKKESMGFDRRIELIFYYATLHAYPALLNIDLQNLVHVFGGINNQSISERLTISTCTTTAGAEHYLLKLRLLAEGGNAHQISRIARIKHALRQYLIDRVIGCQHCAV